MNTTTLLGDACALRIDLDLLLTGRPTREKKIGYKNDIYQ